MTLKVKHGGRRSAAMIVSQRAKDTLLEGMLSRMVDEWQRGELGVAGECRTTGGDCWWTGRHGRKDANSTHYWLPHGCMVDREQRTLEVIHITQTPRGRRHCWTQRTDIAGLDAMGFHHGPHSSIRCRSCAIGQHLVMDYSRLNIHWDLHWRTP